MFPLLIKIHHTAKVFKTSVYIWKALSKILKALINNEVLPDTLPEAQVIPKPITYYLQRAWSDQSNIGFHHLLKGRLSKQWAQAQHTAYVLYPPGIRKTYHTARHWSNAISYTLIHQSLKVWQDRCDLKKGKNYLDKIRIQRRQLLPFTSKHWRVHSHYPKTCVVFFPLQ